MVNDSDLDSWLGQRRGDEATTNGHAGRRRPANTVDARVEVLGTYPGGEIARPASNGFSTLGVSSAKPFGPLDSKVSQDSSRTNGYLRAHPDPRSCGSGSRSRSGSEPGTVRFINPAIYAESLDDENELEVRVRVSRNSDGAVVEEGRGDVGIGVDRFSELSIDADRSAVSAEDRGERRESRNAQDTYRCCSVASAGTDSTVGQCTAYSESIVSGRPSVRAERWCRISDYGKDRTRTFSVQDNGKPEVHRYVANGHRVVQISTSLSSSSVSGHQELDGVALARKLAHDEWVRKKELSVQRKKEEEDRLETKKLDEERRVSLEKEERERRERENFVRWAERKKKEEADRKAAVEKELELQKRLKEIEEKATVAKALYLRQWARRKEEAQKAQQRAQSLRQRQIEEERRKRLEDSAKAYEKWREGSKNRPKPATQGLLPHQKAKPAYINPTPWQGIVVEDSESTTTDALNGIKPKRRYYNSNVRRSIASHQC